MSSDAEELTGNKIANVGALRETLPYARMKEIADSKASDYAAAKPFPHIVIENFFDTWVLDRILGEFPSPRDKNWEIHDIPEEVKLQSRLERLIPLFTRQLLYALNSASFLQFLEEVTGVPKLIGDPQFEGGGLHQIQRGGKLAIHADFNKHLYYNLDRRLNMLVYLNKNWKDEYGGHLELWNKEMTRMERKIAPVFNRVVIFTTDSDSYHGHPNTLTCPRDMTRKSLALYYYTIGEATREGRSARHTTLFQRRPGENFKLRGKQLARDLTPPLLWRMLSRTMR